MSSLDDADCFLSHLEDCAEMTTPEADRNQKISVRKFMCANRVRNRSWSFTDDEIFSPPKIILIAPCFPLFGNKSGHAKYIVDVSGCALTNAIPFLDRWIKGGTADTDTQVPKDSLRSLCWCPSRMLWAGFTLVGGEEEHEEGTVGYSASIWKEEHLLRKTVSTKNICRTFCPYEINADAFSTRFLCRPCTEEQCTE